MDILFAALGLFTLYLIQRRLYKTSWNKHLSATLSYSKESAIEGEEAALIEVITNEKGLPLPGLTVKFQTSRKLLFQNTENSAVTDLYYRSDIFPLNGREKITRTLPITCAHRGYYTITQLALSCSDLLYSTKFSELCSNFTQLYVYPRYVDIRQLLIPFNQLYGAVLVNRHLYEDPFEFRGIREYQPYDPMRSVNWKAYARTGELKVNLYEDTSSQEVRIYLNLENHGYANHYDILEENIRLAATLSHMFISKGIPVSLKTNGCDSISKLPVGVEAGTGAGHQAHILRNLARIDLDITPIEHLSREILADASGNKQLPYMIFISNYCQKDFMTVLEDILKKNENCQLLYTYHKDMQKAFEPSLRLQQKTFFWEVEHID